MSSNVNVWGDISLQGALTLANDYVEFPINPQLGTLVIKGQSLYAFVKIGTLTTWYPLGSQTKFYIHSQAIASLQWTVNHNFGTDNVWFQVKDSQNRIINAARTYIDDNSFQINFTTAITGTVVVVAASDLDVSTARANNILVGPNDEVVIDQTGITISGSPVLTAADVSSKADITYVNSQVSAVQSELDTTQTGAGLNAAGTYTAPVGTNYLGSATSLKNADVLLDTQIKVVDDRITTELAGGNLSALQAELDTTQSAAGLNANGSYTAPVGTNYLGSATSLKNADTLLDTQIKSNDTRITTEEGTRLAADTSLQAEIDNIEAGAGLDANGAYTAPGGTNYLGTSTTIKGATVLLDTQVKTVDNRVATEETTRANADTNLQNQINLRAPLASPTFTGTVTNPTVLNNGPVRSVVVSVAALDIDCSTGNYFTKTISGNSTFTFTNAPGSAAYGFTLRLIHSAGTITWPASVVWAGGSAPAPTAGKTHMFMFVTDNGGTTWRGAALIDYNA